MTTIIITAILSLLFGGVITWVIRKLIFEKNYVSVTQFNDLSQQFQTLQTAKVLADEKNNTSSKTISELNDKLSELNKSNELTKEQLIKATAINESVTTEKSNVLQEKKEIVQALELKTTEANEAAKKTTELTIKLQNQSALYEQQKKDLEQMTDKLKKDFSLLANSILDEKTQKFNETQQKEMNILLEPLKTNLNEFKQQVEKTYKTESEERISLREQVKHMMTLNETLTKEAKSLTLALSGNIKKQGNWGERLLESILDIAACKKIFNTLFRKQKKMMKVEELFLMYR